MPGRLEATELQETSEFPQLTEGDESPAMPDTTSSFGVLVDLANVRSQLGTIKPPRQISAASIRSLIQSPSETSQETAVHDVEKAWEEASVPILEDSAAEPDLVFSIDELIEDGSREIERTRDSQNLVFIHQLKKILTIETPDDAWRISGEDAFYISGILQKWAVARPDYIVFLENDTPSDEGETKQAAIQRAETGENYFLEQLPAAIRFAKYHIDIDAMINHPTLGGEFASFGQEDIYPREYDHDGEIENLVTYHNRIKELWKMFNNIRDETGKLLTPELMNFMDAEAQRWTDCDFPDKDNPDKDIPFRDADKELEKYRGATLRDVVVVLREARRRLEDYTDAQGKVQFWRDWQNFWIDVKHQWRHHEGMFESFEKEDPRIQVKVLEARMVPFYEGLQKNYSDLFESFLGNPENTDFTAYFYSPEGQTEFTKQKEILGYQRENGDERIKRYALDGVKRTYDAMKSGLEIEYDARVLEIYARADVVILLIGAFESAKTAPSLIRKMKQHPEFKDIEVDNELENSMAGYFADKKKFVDGFNELMGTYDGKEMRRTKTFKRTLARYGYLSEEETKEEQ
jgi:hypothetical protein